MFFRNFIFVLLYPTTVLGFQLTGANGVKWEFEVPAGYHVIETQAALDEGLTVRLSNNPNATWENPAPPAGYSLIILGFWITNAPENTAIAASIKQTTPQKLMNSTLTLKSRGIIAVDDYSIPIWLANNDDTDAMDAINTIKTSMRRAP